jgi:2-polyprenyl-3-methyl-5-hydroxy-6-metoxy-1,4-benzoquinol methylase
MNCRFCKNKLKYIFVDLGFGPPSNAYINKENLDNPEIHYPLKTYVCERCWLVQTKDFASAEKLFDKTYAYFSSTSSSFLKHAKNYFYKIKKDLNLDKNSFVIEIASNDGYLLKNFLKAGIPCLGIEPTKSTANFAEKIGIKVLKFFFSHQVANKLLKKKRKADLIIANNVFAHVPDIKDFTRGLKVILKLNGTITIEFPHLKELIKHSQFDTIYHEHFSYLSLYTVIKIIKKFELRVFKVEKIITHGGSLRVYICHRDDVRLNNKSVDKILNEEKIFGLRKLKTYLSFQKKVDKIKNNLLKFLINQKHKNKKVIAYGAAAKGNTLLNYAGIKNDLISCVFDAAKSKQYKFLPGSHIPIYPTNKISKEKADYIIILPWNISSEIIKQYQHLKKNNLKFFSAIPKIKFYD